MREGRPKAFIGSSSEALGIAYALQENLGRTRKLPCGLKVFSSRPSIPWSRFSPRWMHAISAYLFSLPMISRRSGAPRPELSATTSSSNSDYSSAALADRSIFLTPKGADLHIPSDLLGVTGISFLMHGNETNLNAALGPAANRIRNALKNIETSQPGEGRMLSEEIAEELSGSCQHPQTRNSSTERSSFDFSASSSASEMDEPSLTG